MVALAISEISWWIIDPSIGREVDTRSQNSPFSASAGQHLFTLSCQNPPPGGISDGYTQTSPGGCGAPSKKKKIAHHRHVLRYHLAPLCPCLSCGCSILLTLRPRFYISSSLLWPFRWLQQVTSHSTLFVTSRKSHNRNCKIEYFAIFFKSRKTQRRFYENQNTNIPSCSSLKDLHFRFWLQNRRTKSLAAGNRIKSAPSVECSFHISIIFSRTSKPLTWNHSSTTSST